ncbi:MULTISPECIES: recombinase family protein [Streptomyces]|uniref:recombinase family protein n=1 Tax=Streptomyces TaxID=1883 RepID=UPI00163B687B|nr:MULTISPECIES: recombinase family protein [Streptomyces]MBC2875605.1 recombinase family protein [Streptomyces sp. TYQ1024]UBI35835.1 recombinase family protein [Streptomyces mobaraensis]UKW28429.1 recombinase family protein [Streptomyces sp. TYQ1024]
MSATAAPWDRVEGKVQSWHRERLAVVYVRQSTPQQVIDHTESTRLQYGLTQRAVGLGWAPSRVLVIDEDLGHSASGLVDRPGFQRLVSEVGLDHVGLVLGVEMSRLARSGREWHQLLELCALAGALLADPDGVYDPAEHNDRLLLGLKGTISEAELHLIKQRMWNGRIGKARRGELAVPLPVGYLRLADGQVVKDPDEQVQTVVRLVFDLFDELATINAVLHFLVGHDIQIGIRAREGPEKGLLVWRRPSRIMIQNLLRHPAYAGIYVYGRTRTDPRRRIPGRPFTGRVRKPREDWFVYLPGMPPAYTGMDRHRRNLARIEANRARSLGMGALRDGPALLVGLIRCGRCGIRMAVHYQRGRDGKLWPRYECGRIKADYGGELCQDLAGACVDRYVTALLLAAMAPAALEVSLTAAGQAERQRAQGDRVWHQRLERADYPVDRARRQYQLAEPENRLVVRELERNWEQALAERQRLGEEYDRFTAERPRILTAAEREQIRALAGDLSTVWQAPTTTDADRKQLMRQLIEEVRVTVIGDSERVTVQITWAGGHGTHGEVARPVARPGQLSYFPRLSDRARALAEAGHTAPVIAQILNSEGLRPPKRCEVFSAQGVRELLRQIGCGGGQHLRRRPSPQLGPHEWWLTDLACHTHIPRITLYGWIKRGWMAGAAGSAPSAASTCWRR